MSRTAQTSGGKKLPLARLARVRADQAVITGLVITVGLALAPSAAWSTTSAAKSKSAVVVQVATDPTFGQILLSETGAPLYVDTVPPCSKSCLAIWPPVLMPKGKKTPLGIAGLSTVKFGHKLQVTFMGQGLYTFVDDRNSTPTGNGVQGFAVETVSGPSQMTVRGY